MTRQTRKIAQTVASKAVRAMKIHKDSVHGIINTNNGNGTVDVDIPGIGVKKGVPVVGRSQNLNPGRSVTVINVGRNSNQPAVLGISGGASPGVGQQPADPRPIEPDLIKWYRGGANFGASNFQVEKGPVPSLVLDLAWIGARVDAAKTAQGMVAWTSETHGPVIAVAFFGGAASLAGWMVIRLYRLEDGTQLAQGAFFTNHLLIGAMGVDGNYTISDVPGYRLSYNIDRNELVAVAGQSQGSMVARFNADTLVKISEHYYQITVGTVYDDWFANGVHVFEDYLIAQWWVRGTVSVSLINNQIFEIRPRVFKINHTTQKYELFRQTVINLPDVDRHPNTPHVDTCEGTNISCQLAGGAASYNGIPPFPLSPTGWITYRINATGSSGSTSYSQDEVGNYNPATNQDEPDGKADRVVTTSDRTKMLALVRYEVKTGQVQIAWTEKQTGSDTSIETQDSSGAYNSTFSEPQPVSDRGWTGIAAAPDGTVFASYTIYRSPYDIIPEDIHKIVIMNPAGSILFHGRLPSAREFNRQIGVIQPTVSSGYPGIVCFARGYHDADPAQTMTAVGLSSYGSVSYEQQYEETGSFDTQIITGGTSETRVPWLLVQVSKSASNSQLLIVHPTEGWRVSAAITDPTGIRKPVLVVEGAIYFQDDDLRIRRYL